MKHYIHILFLLNIWASFGQVNIESTEVIQFKNAIVNNEIVQLKVISSQLESKYSNNTLSYYKKLLQGLPRQAMLITNGVNDTYPIKILQSAHDINTTVNIVSLKLIKEEKNYRDRIFKKYGLADKDDLKFMSNYFSYLMSAKGVKIYVSNTVSPTTYQAYQSNLSVVGLSLELNCGNQYQKLEAFWNDLNKKGAYKFNLSASEKGVYSNYLVPLLTLYKLKLQSGQLDKVLKKGILHISNVLGKKATVTKIIEKYEQGG